MKHSRDIQGRHAARFFTNSRIDIISAKRFSECGASTGALLAPTFGPSPDICHAVLPSKFGGEREYAETENLNGNSCLRHISALAEGQGRGGAAPAARAHSGRASASSMCERLVTTVKVKLSTVEG